MTRLPLRAKPDARPGTMRLSRSRRPPSRRIARTLPLGSVGYENKTNANGERLIWLERAVVDRLRAMRGPGESYSDLILRLTAESA
jgi:hypothetical protein